MLYTLAIAAFVVVSMWMCSSLEIAERPGLVFFGVDIKGYTLDISPLKGIINNNWYAPSYAWRGYKENRLQRSISTTDAAIWRTYQKNLAKSASAEIREFIAIVNATRTRYSKVPGAHQAGYKYEPIHWDFNLAEGSQNYANCCPRAHSRPMYNLPFAEGLFGGNLKSAAQFMVKEIEAPSCTDNYKKLVTPQSQCGHGGILLTAGTVGCGVNSGCNEGSSVVCRYGTDFGLPAGTLYVYDNNCCNLHPQWYKTWLTYKKGGEEYSTKHAVQQPKTCVSNNVDPNKFADAPYPNAKSNTASITDSWPPVPPRPSPTPKPT